MGLTGGGGKGRRGRGSVVISCVFAYGSGGDARGISIRWMDTKKGNLVAEDSVKISTSGA